MLVLSSQARCIFEARIRALGSSSLHSYCLINNEEKELLASINKENPRGKCGWVLINVSGLITMVERLILG